ncbi:hypothetical protein GCM10009759_69590 [Kitasatospora saccharophila]|uniref:tryptophan--tRNA ligase n=1 Tax=Kitasatospora saccharophila TaxID=407973 RepID=A0ABN2Y336_9ACTN
MTATTVPATTDRDAAAESTNPPVATTAEGHHRILTGDRPTGPLHLGHYFGTLRNRVQLQSRGIELKIVIPDYQAITDRDRADRPAEHAENLVLDYLAVGVDPERATIFTHSAVPSLNQLMLPFLSLVSVAELSRNPTVKDEITHSRQGTVSGLMFTYPVHQAADILFCKADLVPVGQDQLPHLELTRTIARRAELAADRTVLREVLRTGNARANAIADRTLDEVRAAMGTC